MFSYVCVALGDASDWLLREGLRISCSSLYLLSLVQRQCSKTVGQGTSHSEPGPWDISGSKLALGSNPPPTKAQGASQLHTTMTRSLLGEGASKQR